jgi:6-phosphofructokinase
MAPKKSSSKKIKTGGFVIGSARFRKISAVEGIQYSPKMKGASASTDKAPSAEERRKSIIKAYSKA